MLKDRLVVLNDTDQALAEIFKFNQELAEFDKTLSILQGWCDGKAKVRFLYLKTGLFWQDYVMSSFNINILYLYITLFAHTFILKSCYLWFLLIPNMQALAG